jgi:hypothetical protein
MRDAPVDRWAPSDAADRRAAARGTRVPPERATTEIDSARWLRRVRRQRPDVARKWRRPVDGPRPPAAAR